ncbi:MAG: YhcH/YjgK/YiaL family protein [Ginsengibacter sp.]
MKKIRTFQLLLIGITLIAAPFVLMNCNSSKSANSSMSDSKWFDSKTWLNGVNLTPHESINQQEFSRQYHLNNKYWDEAFNYLKTTDLTSIAPGTYIIDSNNVYAIIAELKPNPKEDVKWEAHRNFNDLQYIIKGKAMMGVANVASPTKTVTMPYDPKTDNENFTVSDEKYYDAAPGTFFIFSPKEMHRPAFKADGYDDAIKKIVIKVRVPQ